MWMQLLVAAVNHLAIGDTTLAKLCSLQDDPDAAIEQGHKAIAKAKQANFGEGATHRMGEALCDVLRQPEI